MNIEKVEKCYGCTACKNICPQHCISMKSNPEGFLSPVIDKSKCTNCGLCTKVCPRLADKLTDNKILDAYIAKNKNEKVRLNSTSGGFFSAIADYFIENNGVIYGCILDDDLKVKHVRKEKDYAKMLGSKYVQSDLGDVFSKIKKDLNNNRLVLFTGTPCQCSGLRLYLKKDYSNLYILDLICHGVPSPLLWKEYVNYMTKKKGKILNYYFRSKVRGWYRQTEVLQYENGNLEFQTKNTLINREIFYSDCALRDSCYDCAFASTSRIGDITIGDAWGIQILNKEFDDDKGVNLLLVNSKKGINLFERVKHNLNFIKVDVQNYIQYNYNLERSSTCNKKRNDFWNTYLKKGYLSLIKKYTIYGMKNRLLFFLKRVINILKKISKRIIKISFKKN